jgi:hypothetical protein
LVDYQNLNPLDYMFYVGDTLRRRVGMPGVNIQFLLELGGTLDVEGFNRAVRALHRLYPAAAATLERSNILGRPRWRLHGRRLEPADWLDTRRIEPATAEESHRCCERLLHAPLDSRRRPPVQFTLLRGLPAGDVLAMRWPHFLMDARGGAVLLEELQRLYEKQPDPDALTSAGDEDRDDVGELLAGLAPGARRRAIFFGARDAHAGVGETLRLGAGPIEYDIRGLHYLVRPLDVEQAQRIRDASMRVCGFARLGDFLRACAIQALHRTLRPPRRPGLGYSTMQLIDNRKRRQRGPVCHNFFSALPVHIPAAVAEDRKAAADRIAEATTAALTSDMIARSYAALEQLSRVPAGIVAGLMRRGIRSGPRSLLGSSLAKSPSLPMGFMGSFSRALPEFCGARWNNIYGMGVILPHEGFGLNLNTPNDPKRLNITATYFEPNVSKCKIEEFLDHFTAALQDGG